jgi:hypothetical protein
VLRGVWLIRNDFVFNKQDWSDVKLIWMRFLRLSMEWKPIYKESKMDGMMRWLSFFGDADPRAVADRKRLKLSLKKSAAELIEASEPF